MEFLRLLESIRTPFFDTLFGLISLLGEETIFMLVGIAVIWCFDKKWGFRLFLVGLFSSTLNQLLKAIFLIPRPWVQDHDFTIVESARAGATGYSFPSGHSQGSASLYYTLAAWMRKRWSTIVCTALIALICFSRLYLGVHTPLDVLVGLTLGLLSAAVLCYLFNRFDGNKRATVIIGLSLLVVCILTTCYVLFSPAREASVAEFDRHGQESICTILGAMMGLCVSWYIDERYTNFDVKAVWWAQILKCIVGAGIILTVRIALKAPMNALFNGLPIANTVRYFIIVIVGVVIYPLTFKLWARLGAKKADNAN